MAGKHGGDFQVMISKAVVEAVHLTAHKKSMMQKVKMDIFFNTCGK